MFFASIYSERRYLCVVVGSCRFRVHLSTSSEHCTHEREATPREKAKNENACHQIQNRWPQTRLAEDTDSQELLPFFPSNYNTYEKEKSHLKGTFLSVSLRSQKWYHIHIITKSLLVVIDFYCSYCFCVDTVPHQLRADMFDTFIVSSAALVLMLSDLCRCEITSNA